MLSRYRWLLILALPFWCIPADAGDLGRPLTPEQVACEERQLERMVHRMWVDLEGSTLLFWRSSAAGGLYRGIVSTSEIFETEDGPAREEEQLAFDLVLKSGEDFLDPHRPRRPQATLVRRDAASNIRSEASGSMLELTFDLAPEVSDPSSPTLPIRITNLLRQGAGADDRAGRGIDLDDLVSPCHAEVSEFDLRVFAILARTVRPSQCLAEPFSTCDAGVLERFKVVIFRGAEPLTYRVNVYPYVFTGRTDARVAFELRLQVDERARITGGEVKALPWCVGGDHGGCTFFFNPTIALFVLPPLHPGIERQGQAEFERAGYLNLQYEGSPDNIIEDTVNWADLLRDTAWNGGLVP